MNNFWRSSRVACPSCRARSCACTLLSRLHPVRDYSFPTLKNQGNDCFVNDLFLLLTVNTLLYLTINWSSWTSILTVKESISVEQKTDMAWLCLLLGFTYWVNRERDTLWFFLKNCRAMLIRFRWARGSDCRAPTWSRGAAEKACIVRKDLI